MEESQIFRLQTMLEQLDEQYRILAKSIEKNTEVKKNLTFNKYVKTFKERKDVYYVGIAVSKDPEEVEKIVGYRLQPKKSHFGSFLIIALVLPKSLQLSLVENKFNINLGVQLDKQRLCRTVAVNETSPNMIVIPWTEFPINSEVDISFFGKVNNKNIVFRIQKFLLSMPFFLRPAQDVNNSKYGNYKENLVQISKNYGVNKKCYFNDYNIKYTINIPRRFNSVDVEGRSFPHHLINIPQSLVEDATFQVLKDASEVSHVTIVKGNRFVEIHSDIKNLWKLKQYYINERYNHEAVEILAIKKFLSTTLQKADRDNPVHLYHCLRELWKIHDEEK